MFGAIPAAFASSVSICIASAYESETHTTTSPKVRFLPFDVGMATETISPFVSPIFSASAVVA